MNKFLNDPNLIAFNFCAKTVKGCETKEQLKGAFNMVKAYGRLYAKEPITAFRFRELKAIHKNKLEKICL